MPDASDHRAAFDIAEGTADAAAKAAERAAAQPGEQLPADRRRVIRLAAYGVIRRDDGAVLVCRVSAGYPGVGQWTLPGGGLDFGEVPEDGAIREVEEETGLRARITGPVTVLSDTGIWPRDRDVRYHQVRFVYPMEAVGGQERVEVDGSTDAFGWFDLETLQAMPIVPLVAMALRLRVPTDE